MPLRSEGPVDFYPPVCLKSHWDPTQILKRTLPDRYVAQALDFRPWTRVCLRYTTAGPEEAAPNVGEDVVLPSGGQFYPAERYAGAIDAESQLRRLDRPLGTCEAKQWEPNAGGDLFNARVLLPARTQPPSSAMVEELAYPSALLRSGPYPCRAQQDRVNVDLLGGTVFNAATKQERYKRMGGVTKPAPPTDILKGMQEARAYDVVQAPVQ
jgi:hypothetical protein